MMRIFLFALVCCFFPCYALANVLVQEQSSQEPEESIFEKTKRAAKDKLEEIERSPRAESLLDARDQAEAIIKDVPFAIYQHHQNYLLPFTYVNNPNPAGQADLNDENVDNQEAKFQISIKIPIYSFGNTMTGWYFGFTSRSFWQVYNNAASKPFRETNYEPELMYRWKADYSLLSYRFNAVELSFNHQSNGQSGLNSRSWNRIILSALFSDKDSAYYVRAWYRLPEDEKTSIQDPTGDDNPDITDFIGRAEFGYTNQFADKHKMLVKIRNNLSASKNRGSVELNYTYAFTERYDLLVQYFNGYGDSLIDYNRHQQRIGLGLRLRFL